MEKPRVKDPLLLAGIGDWVYFIIDTQSIDCNWMVTCPKISMSNNVHT